MLPLPSRRREEALFAFSSASHTGRIAGIVDAPQVAFHLAPTTWYASLIDSLVLWRLSLGLWGSGGCAGTIGTVSMQRILQCPGLDGLSAVNCLQDCSLYYLAIVACGRRLHCEVVEDGYCRLRFASELRADLKLGRLYNGVA